MYRPSPLCWRRGLKRGPPWVPLILVFPFRSPRALHCIPSRDYSTTIQETNQIPKLSDSVPPGEPSKLFEWWTNALEWSRTDALRARDELYVYARTEGMSDPWLADLIGLIPEAERVLSDYLFAAECLVHSGEVPALTSLLKTMAQVQPAMGEIVLKRVAELLIKEKRTTALFESLVVFVIGVERPLERLSKVKDGQFVEIIEMACSADPEGSKSGLRSLMLQNPVVYGRLISSVIEILCMRTEQPISRLVESLWTFKLEQSLVTPSDLHRMMFHYSVTGRSKLSLKIYHDHPELQAEWQSDALLLAAARAEDWKQLQTTFEVLAVRQEELHVKGDLRKSRTFGAKHYGIVLQALGFLGGQELLENIFQGLLLSGRLPTRGVMHAMIFSYTLLGDTKGAKRYFDWMIDEYHIEPTRASFLLMLAAYRDAKDLPGALSLMDLMDRVYLLGPSNREITLLLSLCERRRDTATAKTIFKKASARFKPDMITHNAYISCLAQGNLDEAWNAYVNLPAPPTLEILTTLLAMYGRYGDMERVKELQARKKILKLPSDSKWFGALMMAHAQNKDYKETVAIFNMMRRKKFKIEAGHYAILMDLQGKLGRIEEGLNLAEEFHDEKKGPSHNVFRQHLRLLSKQSPKYAMWGYESAKSVIESGMFDPSSSQRPRNMVSARTVEGLVRRLLKNHNIAEARRLVTQLAQSTGVSNPYQLTALRLEVEGALFRNDSVEFLWHKFLRELQEAFVPMEIPDAPNAPNAPDAPDRVIYRIPRRYRFDYTRQVSIRMAQLWRSGAAEELLELPDHLERVGLGMSSQNWNEMVKLMLSLNVEGPSQAKLLLEPFKIANDWLMLRYYQNKNSHPSRHEVFSSKTKVHAQGILGKTSLYALTDSAERLIQQTAEATSASLQDAARSLQKQYPLVMSLLNGRLRKRRQRNTAST